MRGKNGYLTPSIIEEMKKVKQRYNIKSDASALNIIAKHNRIAFEVENMSKVIVPPFFNVNGAYNEENNTKTKQKNNKIISKRRKANCNPLSSPW